MLRFGSRSVNRSGFSFGFKEGAVAQREKAGGTVERSECRCIGAGDPDLAVEPGQDLEQRGAARRIEMGGDLVEQQQRRLAADRALQPGLGKRMAISSAFCSPVDAISAATPFSA